MPKNPQASKLAKEAILKFPKSSKSSIAEMLYENYPAIFPSKEHARCIIKNYTTQAGRASEANKIKRGEDTSFEAIMERYKSNAKERQFKRLNKNDNNILLISDIHFPNQENKAIAKALEYGKKQNINTIIINGDLLDNEPFTSHDAPPPSRNDVVDWFDMCEEFLAMLRLNFPNCRIIWLEGNHDYWYKKYLMKKAPVLFNDEYYDLPNRLNLKEHKIEFYEQHIILLAGKLQIMHGHTILKGVFAPVNAARGVFIRTKSNTIVGHVHATSEHSETNLKGEIIGCWSVGGLCTMSPNYAPHGTKQNLGFAHIEIEKDGNFIVHNKRIIDNKIY